MSDLPCFKCGANVPSKRATHTRDGRIACPNCTKKLGMRIEPRDGFIEVTRMIDRATVERMRDRAAKKAKDAAESNPRGDAEHFELIHSTLQWVLGESDAEPIEARQ